MPIGTLNLNAHNKNMTRPKIMIAKTHRINKTPIEDIQMVLKTIKMVQSG